jgi:hypothetical protein
MRIGPRPCASAGSKLQPMADAASTESIVPRLAAVREQLSLLSDYL